MSKQKKTEAATTPSDTPFAIHHGDCLEMMEAHLPDGSVDLALVDPPYGIAWPGYDSYDDKLKGDSFVQWCNAWISTLYRKVAPQGSFWLVIGDEYVSELDVAAKAYGFYKRSHVIWHYTFGVANQKNFSRSHTHCLYYTKHKSKFAFNADAVRVPSARQLVYGDKRANATGKLPDNTWMLHPDQIAAACGGDTDTWLESRVCGTFKERIQRGKHGEFKTCPQMPRAVVDRMILSTSNPGDLVADCFLGMATTGESAVALGRRFWGCDISETYVAMGRDRLRQATP